MEIKCICGQCDKCICYKPDKSEFAIRCLDEINKGIELAKINLKEKGVNITIYPVTHITVS